MGGKDKDMIPRFDMRSEHPERSEKVAEYKLSESIIVAERQCYCGNCHRRVNLRLELKQCPNENCAMEWSQMILEKNAVVPEQDYLPKIGSDVVERSYSPEMEVLMPALARAVEFVVVAPEKL